MYMINIGLPGIFLGLTAPSVSTEIAILSGGAIEPGLNSAAATFEKLSGCTVDITFNTAPHIRKRLFAGDRFDVVIAPHAMIAELREAGKVEGGDSDIGRVGSGVAVRPGAPIPVISSAMDIEEAVLEAESIVFNLASTGIYIENLFKDMGVWERVEPKTTRYATGAEVMQHVLKGTGREIGFGPITEIMLEQGNGLVYVGPLPPEIQNYTSYSAVQMSTSTYKDEARSLLDFLCSPEGISLFEAVGIVKLEL